MKLVQEEGIGKGILYRSNSKIEEVKTFKFFHEFLMDWTIIALRNIFYPLNF